MEHQNQIVINNFLEFLLTQKNLLAKSYANFLIDPEIKIRIVKFKSIKVLASGELRNPGIGLNHPPIKPATAKPLTTNMLAYSLKKKTAQRKPEYSVIQPATSSDSASGISKGVLFVSATALIKKIKKAKKAKGFWNMIQLGKIPKIDPL